MKKLFFIVLGLLVLVSVAIIIKLAFFPAEKAKEDPVVCTTEAKLCSDGSYVSRIAPDCNFELCPKENLIVVKEPIAGSLISSPLTIRGEARGNWFFEASFPVKLLDESGNIIAEYHAEAKSDWMTTEFVPFEAKLEFSAPLNGGKGTLVLQKDNPSGLPELDDEIRIPVEFELPQMRSVKLYYYSPDKDKDETGNVMCSREGLVAIDREIPLTISPVQDVIKLLLKGELTDEEKATINTEYPLEGFELKGASLQDGSLTLEFSDPLSKTSGGSCRAGILWFQIEATAKQFPEVQTVKFLPEDIFQP